MDQPSPDAKHIFLEAIEKDSPDDRARLLDEAAPVGSELRNRVNARLHAHENAGKFLGGAASNTATVDQPSTEVLGTVIGPYKLLEQIGEGGFGVAYMVEQSRPVRRKVALKILKPGMDSRQILARFDAERQALAIMDHPNIAKVLDGGTTPAGRPFFVMELVKGKPITEFREQNRLTTRQRLDLFVQVCRAVQHAHQKGVIHRDLKPSNVLVAVHDTTYVPKTIDFGIAKALGQDLTENTLVTGFAQMIGTPQYMSPEQAGQSGLDIDTRSDIYSLGVLLYELLTGTTPFTKDRFNRAAYEEIRRIIREEEPPKPSTRLSDSKTKLASVSSQRHGELATLTKIVRGDLDWIVMKCLEKDRNRRYETANGLAADVERYLADEAVQACPPSAMYRLRKFARRNRALMATGVCIGLAVLLAVIVLAVSRERVRRETPAKEVALADRGRALLEAKANFEESQTQEQLAREHASQAEEQRRIARANEKEAKAQTALANRRLYASQMNLAMQAARAGELPRALELLEGLRPTESGEDLRGFEWYHLWR